MHDGKSKAYERPVNGCAPFPSDLEKENPGALAGATGADLEVCDRLESYRVRHIRATQLCHAIAACDPQDACILMVAALEDLSAGTPPPTIRKAMVEARDWAQDATPYELRAYGLACVERMTPEVLTSFVAHVVAQFAVAPAQAEAAR